MKLLIAFLAPVLMLTSIIGCYNPNEETDKILKQLDEDLKKRKFETDKLYDFLYLGGQPGEIKISGSVVKIEGDKTILDDRIKVKQEAGKSLVKNEAVKVNIAEKNKAAFSQKVDDKTVEALQALSSGSEYINIGCNQLDTNLVEGLSEAKLEDSKIDVASASAKTIVVCGKVNLSSLFVKLSADNIILIDTDYTYSNTIGLVSLTANNLTLIGENKISTRGVDAAMGVQTGPSIDLTVTKDVLGDGSLLLSSTGGDCVKETKK